MWCSAPPTFSSTRQLAIEWLKHPNREALLKNNQMNEVMDMLAAVPSAIRVEILDILAKSGVDVLSYVDHISSSLFEGFEPEYCGYNFSMYNHEFVVPDNIHSIYSRAFYNNSFYTSIILPSHIKFVNSTAFNFSKIQELVFIAEDPKVKIHLMYLNNLKRVVIDPLRVANIDKVPNLEEWYVPHDYLAVDLDYIKTARTIGCLPNLRFVQWRDKTHLFL